MDKVRVVNVDGKNIQSVTIDGRDYLFDGKMFDEFGVIKPWTRILMAIGKNVEKPSTKIVLGKTDQVMVKMLNRGEKPDRNTPTDNIPLTRWQNSYDKLVKLNKIK
jgi:hypothetical protein